ncbi:MFS transporter [Candidatus Uabimicrobium sp. HlEnr_7]|uniref:MFS transporter n=1 Tax=Candidatus Uabimicrobium helgolandensis TaxID=3095367 RepID=UPI003558C75C
MKLRTKIGYGTAELGIIGVEMVMRLYLLIFYTDTIGLNAGYAGYAVALAVIWDAITDPVIGVISDRTTTKLGKRTPFIFCGGIFLALSILVIMNPPQLDSQWQKFSYLLVSYIILNTSMTILSIPHAALGGELSEDSDERTELYGWRFLFANIGALLAAALPNGYFISVVVFLSSVVTVFSTNKYDNAPVDKTQTTKLFSGIPQTTKNTVFLYLLISYVIATIGLAINSTFAMYYYKYYLQLSEQKTQVIIGVFILVVCLSIVFWVKISQKYGKKWPAFGGILSLAIMTTFSYPFFPKNNMFFPLCAAVLGGIMVGATALLDAIVADTVDYDAAQTGRRQEGLYFGVWRMGSKVSRAVAIALCGLWLEHIGFIPNEAQTMQIASYIAYMFGPGVGCFLLLSAIIFYFLPYSEKEHEKWRRQYLSESLK